jgi:hypothetical protein
MFMLRRSFSLVENLNYSQTSWASGTLSPKTLWWVFPGPYWLPHMYTHSSDQPLKGFKGSQVSLYVVPFCFSSLLDSLISELCLQFSETTALHQGFPSLAAAHTFSSERKIRLSKGSFQLLLVIQRSIFCTACCAIYEKIYFMFCLAFWLLKFRRKMHS